MDLNYTKQRLHHISQEKRIEDMKHYISDEDGKQIVQHANQLIKHIITFDKPWDMERCTIPYQLDKIDWNIQRNEDEEWCFMLNRMDYLSDLMLATLLTQDDKYMRKGKEWILDWIRQHKQMKPEPSTRTLDTGIRIMNIMETLPYIYKKEQISDDELSEILTHLQLQIDYLKEHYLTKYTLSNWGSIQTCAILSVLPFLKEDFLSDAIYQWAYEEWSTQFSIQVYEDGMQWEQSTMYHIEVLNYGMKALYYQDVFNQPNSRMCKEQIYRMADALFYQITPDHQIETFGDSDRVSICDVFHRASVLFQQPIWKSAGAKTYDADSVYAFGCNWADDYAHLDAQIPDDLVYDGEDSGMFTMRSSWDALASFTMFTNGSLGSGHGHSDNLHVSLYHHGVPVLIDPGRYTYREDHPLRVELKSMHAHNSVLVDHMEYCLPSDSWGYHDFGIPCKNYIRHTQGIHYIEGMMIGHSPLQVWTRKLIVIDPDIWMIVDEMKIDGNHTMEVSFSVDPNMHAGIGKDLISLCGESNLYMLGEVGSIQKGICSLRYNEANIHDIVSFHKAFQDEGNHITAVVSTSIQVEKVDILQNGTEPLNEEIAEARRFTISPEESYTIVVFHKELFRGKKLCTCEGLPFHAKCVVIHNVKGMKKLIRLRA